jgi:hypothetical protein
MKKRVWIPVFLTAGLMLTTTGCASNRRVVVHEPASKVVVVHDVPGPGKVVVVKKRPPKVRREARPHRPSRRHVWIPGHWEWRGNAYVWKSGRWVVPPRAGAVWVPGRWKQSHGGWIFVAGYWR